MMDSIIRIKSACSQNFEFLEVFENFIKEVERAELFKDEFGVKFTKNPSSLQFIFLNQVFRFDYSFIIDSQSRYWGSLSLKHINKLDCSVCQTNHTAEVIYKSYYFDKLGNTKRSLEETSSPLSISIEDSIKEFFIEILLELLDSDYFVI